MGGGIIDFLEPPRLMEPFMLDVRVHNILPDRFVLLKDWADQLDGRVNLSGTASVRGVLGEAVDEDAAITG